MLEATTGWPKVEERGLLCWVALEYKDDVAGRVVAGTEVLRGMPAEETKPAERAKEGAMGWWNDPAEEERGTAEMGANPLRGAEERIGAEERMGATATG